MTGIVKALPVLITYGGVLPIYEYQCESCSHKFELKQSFDAEPTQKCPSCSATSKRLFHPPAVIYKGTGFYTTDYGRKNYAPPAESKDSPSTPSNDKPAPATSTPSNESSAD